MIYVVTLNPSLDYYMKFDGVAKGKTNHSIGESLSVGGKGINTAIMLNNLSEPTTLYGFVGGFTGKYLIESLKNYPHIRTDFVETQAMTRINVKIQDAEETELNGLGETVTESDITQLENRIDALTHRDFVMISGRVAKGMEDDWYLNISKKLQSKDIPFSLDISSSLMKKICQYQPLLIKPNVQELGLIFGETINSMEDIIRCGKELIALGAKHCIVSMGDQGSLMFTNKGIFQASPIKGNAINAVGAGDSMVAGFVQSYLRDNDSIQAYRNAIACGTATAFSDTIGNLEMVKEILSQINIIKKGD